MALCRHVRLLHVASHFFRLCIMPPPTRAQVEVHLMHMLKQGALHTLLKAAEAGGAGHAMPGCGAWHLSRTTLFPQACRAETLPLPRPVLCA